MQRIKSTLCTLLFLSLCLNNLSYSQIPQIRQELRRLSSIKDSLSKVNSLIRLGVLYRTRNADSCFYYGMEAKHIATDIHNQQEQKAADILIGYALFKRGLYAESLELLGSILPYYQQLGDTEKVIRIYVDMADVLNKGIDKTKVVSFLQRAIQTGKKLEKDSVMSEVYLNYCNRNSTLSTDSIKYYLSKSREIASRYQDKQMLAYNRMLEAHFRISSGQRLEVLPVVKQLKADAQRIGDTKQEINSLMLMANIFFYKPRINPKTALECYLQAYEVAQKGGDSYLEIYILNCALEVAEYLNDKDQIIKIHVEMEKAMMVDWEKTRKFIGDYVSYNSIQNNNKLLSAENAQRTLWLLIISFAGSIIVLTTYLMMLRRSRKAKAQIEALNSAANMQIIAMEEAKHQAIREEQQRLGQDLHDGLSSSIAAVRHQLEVLSIDTNDIGLKNKLSMLLHETENAYKAARNKSHEWFSSGEEQQEASFEKQIKQLTDSSLPESRYNKTIHIDNSALIGVDMDTRIALLRIIQEAITNIIKHAKAKNVEILIYEEEDTLLLTINDDGIGLDEKKSRNGNSAMGLESIRRRVEYLSGEINIGSDINGTEIIVSIPLK